MQTILENFKPFDSSAELNIFAFSLLALLTLHISKSYLLDLAKRVPMKSQRFNIFTSSSIQTALLSLSSIMIIPLYFTDSHYLIPQVTGFNILFFSGFSITFISLYLTKKISFDSSLINKLISLSIITINSCILHLFDFRYKYLVHFVLSLIALVGLAIQFKSSYISVIEPNTIVTNTVFPKDFLTKALFLFEIVLENIIMIPESVMKKYSLNLKIKMVISPLIVNTLLMKYFNIPFSLTNCLALIVLSSILSWGLIGCALKKVEPSISFNVIKIYGFIVTGTLLSLIFHQTLKITQNLVDIFNISPFVVIPALLGPVIAIPSIVLQTHFIKSGFQMRSFLSIILYISFNVLVNNIFQSILVSNARSLSDLWSSYSSISLLIFLVIYDIFKNEKKFTKWCWYYGTYSIMQGYVIMILYHS
jgi:hypothetical protein